jgi:hypothetical protein
MLVSENTRKFMSKPIPTELALLTARKLGSARAVGIETTGERAHDIPSSCLCQGFLQILCKLRNPSRRFVCSAQLPKHCTALLKSYCWIQFPKFLYPNLMIEDIKTFQSNFACLDCQLPVAISGEANRLCCRIVESRNNSNSPHNQTGQMTFRRNRINNFTSN